MIGVIHTYITGLLFRPSNQEETPNLYLTLPPIHNSRRNSPNGEPSNLSNARHLTNFSFTNALKGPDFVRRTLEDMEETHNNRLVSHPVNYPKRVKTTEEFR